MPRPASPGTTTSSLADAEQRLLDVLFEKPSIAERLLETIASRRNLILALAIGGLWSIGNHALTIRAGASLDPFPFRGMQRVFVGMSLALALVAARAYSDRERRSHRLVDAQRAVAEAARWAATSRTLKIMAQTRTDPEGPPCSHAPRGGRGIQ